jgi:hypothetical protein
VGRSHTYVGRDGLTRNAFDVTPVPGNTMYRLKRCDVVEIVATGETADWPV